MRHIETPPQCCTRRYAHQDPIKTIETGSGLVSETGVGFAGCARSSALTRAHTPSRAALDKRVRRQAPRDGQGVCVCVRARARACVRVYECACVFVCVCVECAARCHVAHIAHSTAHSCCSYRAYYKLIFICRRSSRLMESHSTASGGWHTEKPCCSSADMDVRQAITMIGILQHRLAGAQAGLEWCR